jgi:chemotaxis protein methyltransferase CheR
VAFLQWCLPRLRMRWAGFRKVRRQVCRRIARRMEELELADLAAYRRHLEAHPEEWPVLDGLCRVTISRLYRDRSLFDFLGAEGLPALARVASAEEAPLRCWSAGCASGEEPYTLAILWEREVAAHFPSVRLEIVATDSDLDLLARARAGIYGASSLKEIPEGWRPAALVPDAGGFRVRDEIRGAVRFLRQDIRREMPAGPFHLVLCRNLAFTYFDRELQEEILASAGRRLHRSGLLVLGSHERLPGSGAGWDRSERVPWVYRRAAEGSTCP